jgi:hypothetical protein
MTVPYPPGARDTWDNVFLQRAAGHVWNAQRNMAALIGAKTEEERKRGIKARLDDVLATAGAVSLARRRADQSGLVHGGLDCLHRCRSTTSNENL